jgi:molybdopterin molybdotransferase
MTKPLKADSKLIAVEKALKFIARKTGLVGTELISLENTIGRILAQDIVADTDLPPFDRSQMDGYAVKSADTKNTPATLRLVGESAAGRGWHKTLNKGKAVRIMTGAPLPKGADAVQKLEVAKEDGDSVTLLQPTEIGRFIVPKGEEVKKGTKVLKIGEMIDARNISVPAAFGYSKLSVSKRPRVAILSTGTELVEISKTPKQDQIRNSNSVMLKSLCEQTGAAATILPNIGDSLSDLKFQISNSVKTADILITTGGVSVGKYDLTKLALTELGAEIFFERVALKPGKPTVFAKLGKSLVFALPGNPVSAAVTFYLFARTAILLMQGARNANLEFEYAVAGRRLKGAPGRDSYLPVQIESDTSGQAIIQPLKWNGSSDFIAFSKADALVFVPMDEIEEEGEVVRFLRLPV